MPFTYNFVNLNEIVIHTAREGGPKIVVEEEIRRNNFMGNYILYSSLLFLCIFKCSLSSMSIFSSPHDDSCHPMSQGHLFWDYNLIFLVSHPFTNLQKTAQPSDHNSYNKAIDHRSCARMCRPMIQYEVHGGGQICLQQDHHGAFPLTPPLPPLSSTSI